MLRAIVLPFVLTQVCLVLLGQTWIESAAAQGPAFVGTVTCAQCHPEQAERFEKFSKKAHSFTSIRRLAGKLTEQERRNCYSCHTTGYGKPGGFVSESQTPDLMNLGCETCHGPGGVHLESEDPEDLTPVAIESCMACHNEERVAAFNFKPMLFGGGH